jgi:hypothetical protein
MQQLTVRAGQGDKDRCTTVPAMLTPLLRHHLAGVKTLHPQDLGQGHTECRAVDPSGARITALLRGEDVCGGCVSRGQLAPR